MGSKLLDSESLKWVILTLVLKLESRLTEVSDTIKVKSFGLELYNFSYIVTFIETLVVVIDKLKDGQTPGGLSFDENRRLP